MKNIPILFGGNSPEHEVSIITGLEIFEHIDRELYNPLPIFVSEDGTFYLLDSIKNRRDFSLSNKKKIYFDYDPEQKAYLLVLGGKKYPIHVVINCMHGGGGESGHVAGLLDSYNIPYTSSDVESSVVCMNKALSKEYVKKDNVAVIPGLSYISKDIVSNVKIVAEEIKNKLGLPAIIKPVHLGSSIGIKIAKSPIELELGLLEATRLDTEILIEQFYKEISEFNCSVRMVGGKICTSEIERPLPKEEILSFSEKYEKGGKKVSGGMASLSRELPASISPELSNKIKEHSEKIYKRIGCKGIVRIDFIQSKDGAVFFNEINPIPGSMAFYLWEVMGIPFRQLLTELIEETKSSHTDHQSHVHKTNIIKTFIDNYKY